LLCLFSALGLLALPVRAADDKEVVSRLDAIVARAADQGYADLDALCQVLMDVQRANSLLVPPGMDYCEFPQGLRVFEPKGFPEDFLAGLIPAELDGATAYPVRISETDDGTLELRNAKDDVFYKVEAPSLYSPLWLVLSRYGSTVFWSKPTAEREELAYLFDPSRVGVSVMLLEAAELYTILETQAKAAESQEFEIELFRGMADGTPVSDLMITAIEPSNTVRLTISYPSTSTYSVIDVFSCDGGQALSNGWWVVSGQTNRNTSTNFVHYWDPAGPGETRFYTCANGDVVPNTNSSPNDLDGDLLSNVRERLVYHTSSTTNNTDGDAYGDYDEVMTYRTDPNNSDGTKPAAAIVLPVNATLKEVLP